MSRKTTVAWALGAVLSVGLSACASDAAHAASATASATASGAVAAQGAPVSAGPRTILLGIDGLDPVLVRELVDAGRLPHMARLAAQGGGPADLGTAWPPQSPVSWASFNTACNPGRHGVAGFVYRVLPDGVGTPMPMPNLGTPVTLTVEGPDGPEQVPYERNPVQLDGWWRHLDAAGIRFTGVQLGSVFPPDREGPNTRVLAGLGVKDISGSPGSWNVFTDDPWAYDTNTNSGGRIWKIFFDERAKGSAEPNQARVQLRGPKDWRAEREFTRRIADLEARLADGAASLRDELDGQRAEFDRWRRRHRTLTAEVALQADRDAGTVLIDVQGRRTRLAVGEWSDLIPVAFRHDAQHAEHGLVRFLLLRCDDEEVRLVTPAIMHDPSRPPEHLPLSAPPHFVRELASASGGHFETLGWAGQTNPLKDGEIDAQDFLTHAAGVMERRAAILRSQLDAPEDWEVYTQVLSIPDRVSHMLFRERDPDHPAHDAETAARVVQAWGREFPLSDAIAQSYEAVDRILGDVLARIDAGELGDDCLLVVFSDHGFQPFRRQVNLNNLLWEHGYLVFKDGATSIDELTSKQFLMYVDWERTRAYSMGLGKIYLNLQGREPLGSVAPSEAAAVARDIVRDLTAASDPADGAPLFSSLVPREELFHGPWVGESDGIDVRVADELRSERWDGFADLFAGFAPGYRVSWNNTMGGLDGEAVLDNTNRWSGGHVSVDPRHVPGVLLSNRPLVGEAPHLMDLGPTVLERHGVDATPLGFDGHALEVR